MDSSSTPERPRRIGVLVPMRIELDPVVRLLDLVAVDDDGPAPRRYRGNVGELAVDAWLTDIGMGPATVAAREAVADGADWIVVCGVAGGVGDTVDIGDLVVPESVVDRSTGRRFQPAQPPHSTPRGEISCGDDLITDPATLAAMAAQGIVAVDMETAAVAAVCDEAGRPWTVLRAISDHAAGGLVDAALFALTEPDGRSDPAAIARYLDEDPTRRERLARLASDTARATEAAATATAAFCRSLAGLPGRPR
jgi:adenosylhomocysteine nucleosidase